VRSAGGALAVVGVLAVVGCGTSSAPGGAEPFEVASWEWDGRSGMDALVTGSLTIDDRGCTFAAPDLPVLFPNAVGLRYSDGTRAVVHADSFEVYAVEGRSFEYGGGYLEATADWSDRCGPHDGEVAVVTDDPVG
jgi:hypothetical protein